MARKHVRGGDKESDYGQRGHQQVRYQKPAKLTSLVDLGEVMGVGEAPVPVTSPAKPTIVEVAQELQCTTNFVDFVFGGHGSTLLFGGVIFGYVIEERQNGEARFFMVLHSDNPKLPVGFRLSSDVVAILAAEGVEKYFPWGEAASPETENKKAAMVNIFLEAIRGVGGHSAVLKAIEAKQHEAEHQAECQERVRKIGQDIANGTLSGNPMMMFDAGEIHTFGFVISGKPVVLRSGMRSIVKGRDVLVHCVWLLSDPLQSNPDYTEGTFVQTWQLFDEEHSRMSATTLAAALRSLFSEEQVDEAKRFAEQMPGHKKKVINELAPASALVAVPMGMLSMAGPGVETVQ